LARGNKISSIKRFVRVDLFHGDASFKPVDWRIRVTPELSLNNLKVRELGIVGPIPAAARTASTITSACRKLSSK